MAILKEGVRHFINSTKTLVDAYETSTYVTAKELGKRHGFNYRMIIPTFHHLSIAGITTSRTGGRNQGYALSCSPKDVTLADVFRATTPIPEAVCTKHCLTHDGGDCIICSLFNKDIAHLLGEYDKITLSDYAQLLETTDGEILAK